MENKHAPLPAGWKLRRGYLVDPDGYERWVEDGRGRLDNTRIAAILENHNLDARRWYLTSAEFAGPELLEACKLALPFLEEYRERVIKGEIKGKLLTGDYAPVNDLRRAIAAAEGRE